MLKSLLIRVAESVAPDWSNNYRQFRYWRREARKLRDECRALTDIAEVVDKVLYHPVFRAVQRPQEIAALLTLLRASPPRCLCEIGSDHSGTLFLFASVAHANARILTIDLGFSATRRRVVKHLRCGQQQLDAWRADSHTHSTLQRTERWLAGAKFDFLFIDGDHTLDGVSQDFEMYAPLVKAGGMIALHDIVPDSSMRCGIQTAADVGQVPLFWSYLREQGYQVRELIADREQDGMGIGVVYWPGTEAQERG